MAWFAGAYGGVERISNLREMRGGCRPWASAIVVAAALGLAGCGDDDGLKPPPTTGGPVPEDVGLPADAEYVTTPEGGGVYVSESEAVVYGACENIDPHDDDIAGWLGIDPPPGFSNYGKVCL